MAFRRKVKDENDETSSRGLLATATGIDDFVRRRPPTFRTVTFRRIGLFFGFVFGNCVTMGSLVYLLWFYNNKSQLSAIDKRIFNAVAIFLSALLGLGIGFLLDALALLARGYILLKKPHTLRAVGYIVRGTLSSQLMFLGDKMSRKNFDQTAILVMGFLLFGIFGRLSVAFLGLSFNVDERAHHDPSLDVTPWPFPRADWSNISMAVSPYNYSIPELLVFAESGQVANQIYFPNTNLPYDFSLNSLKNYTGADLNQTIEGKSISYLYDIANFEDRNVPIPSGLLAVSKAECEKVKILGEDRNGLHYQENGVNKTFWYIFGSAFDRNFTRPADVGVTRCIAFWRNGGLVQCGQGCVELWIWHMPSVGNDTGILFHCRHTVVPPKPSRDELLPTTDKEYSIDFPPELTYWMPALPAVDRLTSYSNFTRDYYKDYNGIGYDQPTYEFMEGAIKSSQGHLWVAATISRYTAILIRQLNRVVMPKIEVRKASDRIISTLSVIWGRVIGLLGAFVLFQIIISNFVLWSCIGSILVEDDVITLGNLLGPLPELDRPGTGNDDSSKYLMREVPAESESRTEDRRVSLVIEQWNGD